MFLRSRERNPFFPDSGHRFHVLKSEIPNFQIWDMPKAPKAGNGGGLASLPQSAVSIVGGDSPYKPIKTPSN